MKKTRLVSLFLPVLVFSSNAGITSTTTSIKSANGDVTSENATLAASLSGAYRLETSVTTSYDDASYKVNIESDDEHFNIATYNSDDSLLSTYHYRDVSGTAYLDTLNIKNEVDSTSTGVTFDTYYAGPFASISDEDDIEDYFDVTTGNDYLTYTANEYGLGVFTADFLSYFSSFNSYSWDSTTTSSYIKNLVITTDTTGVPTDLSFNLVTSDRYGGVYETFTGTFTVLSEGTDLALTPRDSLMNAESSEYQALKSAFDTLYANIKTSTAVNFIEHIDMSDEEGNSLSYENYYDFDLKNPGDSSSTASNFMLSTYPLTDSDYGETFTGLRYDYIYLYTDPSNLFPAFYAYGISPDSSYADILYSEYWEDVDDILPRINDFSVDFFSYDSTTKTYTFDISEFEYADYYFGVDVLDALFGQGDYLSHILGTYTSDGEYDSFDFDSVVVDLEGEYPTFTLNYNYLGVKNKTTVYFSDFGTTDLADNEDLEACLDLYDSLYGE